MILAFYDDNLHAGQIPAERVMDLDEQQYAAVVENPNAWRVIDNQLVENPNLGQAVIPRQVTKLQLKRALTASGQWATFKTILASDPEAQEDWDLAVYIRREDPAVIAMAEAACVTDPSDIDMFFVAARSI
ncbi:MAG: hypothetical protein AAGF44_07175 [Pseudomonadota bacterium]